MAAVSAVIICNNEAARIRPCLESLSWADEIVAVDSGSTDGTPEICREYTDKVYYVPFVNFPTQRNVAMTLASYDWIFFIDADERMEPALIREVQDLGPQLDERGPAAWAVPRRNFIWGAWVRGGGWYPDHQVRLMDRRRSRYDETRAVHEVVLLEGSQSYLQNELLHLNYQSLGQFLEKQERYARLHAQTLRQVGGHARLRSVIGQPVREFARRYGQTGGWKDGWRGLALAMLMAYYQGRAYWLSRRVDPAARG